MKQIKQLFVCHTQYNLILATGISTSEDELILFRDFNLTDELKRKLKSHFSKCLILEGNYPKKELSAKEKLKTISSDNDQIGKFIQKYDRIFIVDDMCIQEMHALKCAYKKNSNIEMVWLEDGTNAYFSNGVVSGGMGGTPLKRAIRKVFFTARYGLLGFYDLASCMGGHKKLQKVYLTFPEFVRAELKTKESVAITDKQVLNGMQFMYGGKPIEIEENSVVFTMDLLSVYGDTIELVNRIVDEMVHKAEENGKTVYCKYHPRETDKLPALSSAAKLDSKVGFESYLTNSTAKDLTIVGVKSTALQTARKMGYEVVSLIQLVEDDCDNIISFYERIGIKCLKPDIK